MNTEPRESYQIQTQVTALTSISHIGESHGINSKLRREKFILPDGTPTLVPIISGNAIRGLLRDLGMRYMLIHLGLGDSSISLPAYHFLFSGGSLTRGGGNKALDIDQARKLQTLIPLVGIFGGSVGNEIIPGRLRMGKIIPICAETLHLLPVDKVAAVPHKLSIWEYLQEEAYTRRDDEKNPHLRGFITEKERLLLDVARVEKQQKRGTQDDVDREVGQHQQMRYFIETYAAGTKFFWQIGLLSVTRIEFEAFLSCFLEFSKSPVIGGKGAVGHGQISIKAEKWFTVNPYVQAGEAIDMPIGSHYHEFLDSNRDSILNLINKFE